MVLPLLNGILYYLIPRSTSITPFTDPPPILLVIYSLLCWVDSFGMGRILRGHGLIRDSEEIILLSIRGQHVSSVGEVDHLPSYMMQPLPNCRPRPVIGRKT